MVKVLKQFDETNWFDGRRGKGQLALRALRCGDTRQTGALRRKEFENAMRQSGILLDRREYDLLFDLFDRDGSGDVTYEELLKLLDDSYTGRDVDKDSGDKSSQSHRSSSGGQGSTESGVVGASSSPFPMGARGTALGRGRSRHEAAQRIQEQFRKTHTPETLHL